MVLDFELIENSLHFQDKFRSTAGFLRKILEVHGMIEKENHFYLIHVFDLLHYQIVIQLPKALLLLQVPAPGEPN